MHYVHGRGPQSKHYLPSTNHIGPFNNVTVLAYIYSSSVLSFMHVSNNSSTNVDNYNYLVKVESRELPNSAFVCVRVRACVRAKIPELYYLSRYTIKDNWQLFLSCK